MKNNIIKIAILGSTGNIGQQVLDVIREHKDKFKVIALTTNQNIRLLEKQIIEFEPQHICITSPRHSSLVPKLRKELTINKKNYKPVLHSGNEGLSEIATLEDVDLVFIAVCGFSGVIPTLEAIKAKKMLAIATKEVFVAAGEIVREEIKKQHGLQKILCFISDTESKGKIFPVDSEHSAICQCLIGEKIENVRNIILTCSGGPFRNFSKDELRKVSLKDVLKHPVWKMGKKISVDSATLMNKSFEVIEAHYLFNIPYENIKIVIHPEAIVHSMVEFIDGNMKALLSYPDMRIPIKYALFCGERNFAEKGKEKKEGAGGGKEGEDGENGREKASRKWEVEKKEEKSVKQQNVGLTCNFREVPIEKKQIVHIDPVICQSAVQELIFNPNFKRLHSKISKRYKTKTSNTQHKLPLTLSFGEPDIEKFPCLKFGYEAGKEGGTMPTVLNAADEVAVESFIKGKISFSKIPIIVEKMMEKHNNIKNVNLDIIIKVDEETKKKTQEYVNSIKS